MAKKTKCLTPGCIFRTTITPKGFCVSVDFPKEIPLRKKEAKVLERLLHNAIEIVLRPYFTKLKNLTEE